MNREPMTVGEVVEALSSLDQDAFAYVCVGDMSFRIAGVEGVEEPTAGYEDRTDMMISFTVLKEETL